MRQLEKRLQALEAVTDQRALDRIERLHDLFHRGELLDTGETFKAHEAAPVAVHRIAELLNRARRRMLHANN